MPTPSRHPRSVLGYEVGDWHVRPDLLARYLEVLAEASDRAVLQIQGSTHEMRPQPLLVITSPSNHARLEEIRRRHVDLADPRLGRPTDRDLADLPAVAFLGFSVHGNEASGANASMLVAYHLTAAQDKATTAWLEEVVVLLDPSLNPDGLGRFSQWVNSRRALGHLVADPESVEHHEPWPAGRGNHYWFDLNRDWLLASAPRVAQPSAHPASLEAEPGR